MMKCSAELWIAILVDIAFTFCAGEHGTSIITSHKNDDPKLYIGPVTTSATGSILSSPASLQEIGVSTDAGTDYRVSGLAFDPVDQKLYWVERQASNVRRSDLNGGNQEDIANSGTGTMDPREVCLDIYNRVIYWTEQGSNNAGSVKTRPMDLSEPASVVPGSVTGGDTHLHACAYGPISKSLYLVYGGERISTDGNLVKLPVDGIALPIPVTLDEKLLRAISIDVDEAADELFYGTYDYENEDVIKKFDLKTGDKTTVFTGRNGGLRDIFIHHDLLYVADFLADTVYTVPRTGNMLTNGDETELTLTYPNPGDGDETQNAILVSACPPSVCTACVSNVAATVDSAYQLSVTWDKPIPSVCNAHYYTVTATPSNIDQCSGVASDSDTKTIEWQTQYSLQLTNLLPNTDYVITVTPGLTDSTNPSAINAGDPVVVSYKTNDDAPSGTPGVVITSATDNSVNLAFTEPQCGSKNGDIVSFTYYCSNGLTRTLEMKTPINTPTAIVTDLSCDGGLYTCFAAAINDVGTGPYAELIVNGSISSVPTSAPCNVMITQASSSDITFEWEKCACGTRGGVTQSFPYRLWSNGQITMGETSDLSMTFNIPICKGYYKFEVAVRTFAGTGPYAQKEFRDDTELGAEPVIVSSIVTFETLVIEILEKPCVLDEVQVLSYLFRLIQFSEEGQTEVVITDEVKVEEDGLTTIVISDLQCETNYQLSIAARTANGLGPETIFNFATDSSPNPFRPGSSLLIRKVSSSTTIVSWETSLSECPSTEFVVQYRLENLEQCEVRLLDTWTRISTSESEIILSNLNGGSLYSISVTGQTSSDVDMTLHETWTTLESAPTVPPTEINIVGYTENDLVIEWVAPPCGSRGGFISYEYELMTETDRSVVNRGTTTAQMIQIRPPSGYVNYSFQVAAVNSAGSIYSNIINIKSDSDDGIIIAIALVSSVIAVTAAGVVAGVCVLRRRRNRRRLQQPLINQPQIEYSNQDFQPNGFNYFQPFSATQSVLPEALQ